MNNTRRTIYAVVTQKCNLSCNYCDIMDNEVKETYNRDEFLAQLLNARQDYVILFGGEPTMYVDRLTESFITGSVNAISTNLMHTEPLEAAQSLLRHLGLPEVKVTTSWSYDRFRIPNNTGLSAMTYLNWRENMRKFKDVEVLVTMTDDLLNIHYSDFFNIANDWDCSGIRFEYLLSDNPSEEYYQKADKWLCELYKRWDIKSSFVNADMISTNGLKFDCTNVYTLMPNGELYNGCPHIVIQHRTPMVPEKCYGCELVKECRPCKLQKYCSYPKEFAKLVRSDKNV